MWPCNANEKRNQSQEKQTYGAVAVVALGADSAVAREMALTTASIAVKLVSNETHEASVTNQVLLFEFEKLL